MSQLVLSGGLLPVAGRVLLSQLSWLAPARWAFAATASSTELRGLPGSSQVDGLWQHSASVWLADMGVLVALSVAFVTVVAVLLRRLEPRRRTAPRAR